MTRTISAGLAAHCALEVTTLTFLFRVATTESTPTVLGFTRLDADVVWDDGDGSVTYQSALGFDQTAVTNTITMAVGNLDIGGLFGAAGIEKEDFETGLMDHASVRLHLVNYENLADGSVVLLDGKVGEVRSADTFSAELRSLLHFYMEEVVEEISPTCRVEEFMDSAATNPRCYLEGDAPAWSASFTVTVARIDDDATGEEVVRPLAAPNDRWFVATTTGTTGGGEPSWNLTLGGETTDNTVKWKTLQARRLDLVVATVTNEMTFVLTTTTDAPDSFFKAGQVKMTSGANSGRFRGISSWDLSTKTVRLFEPFPETTVAGDTITLFAGCDRRMVTCTAFDNSFNFRGEKDLPGNIQIFQFPNQPSG